MTLRIGVSCPTTISFAELAHRCLPVLKFRIRNLNGCLLWPASKIFPICIRH